VENEYTAQKLVLFAIFVPKISAIGGNLTKVLTKNKFAQLFLDTVYIEDQPTGNRPTNVSFWKISNGHISFVDHPIHFMFGSTLGFSGSADRMALFPFSPNPRWRMEQACRPQREWSPASRSNEVTVCNIGIKFSMNKSAQYWLYSAIQVCKLGGRRVQFGAEMSVTQP